MSNAISIVSKEPGDGKIVKKGDRITLSCKTNRKWFFCLWKGPTGSTQVIYNTKTAINMFPFDQYEVTCDVINPLFF